MRGRGGGSKAVWNFSENSSILEGEGVPKDGSTNGQGDSRSRMG